MKTAIVPAQVTTIEDRIAGNFTIAQMLIMMAGFGLASLVYLLMSPTYHFSAVKISAIVTIVALTFPLAIRINGKIVADWLIILSRFMSRPHRYIFTKNDAATRSVPIVEPKVKVAKTETKLITNSVIEKLTVKERRAAEGLLDNPGLAVRFVMAEKGGIDVSLTPVKR